MTDKGLEKREWNDFPEPPVEYVHDRYKIDEPGITLEEKKERSDKKKRDEEFWSPSK